MVSLQPAFKTNVVFQNEDVENFITAICILIGLKSFEFIIKTLLTSTRGESVNTGKYSLQIAVEQSLNPYNWFRWARGRPDFSHGGELKQFRKPIPLNRATLAVLISVIVLLLEGAFFFGTMSKNRDLHIEDLTLSVQPSNTHTFRKFTKNYCAPISVETGRAKLTAVFAFCNEEKGTGGGFKTLAESRNLRVDFTAGAYSQAVKLTDITTNATLTSRTVFSILVPDKDEHLVVPYLGKNALTALVHEEIMGDLTKKRNCNVNTENRASGRYELRNCNHEVALGELMRLVLTYTTLNTTSGKVGHEVGDKLIASEGETMKLGSIEQLRMTAVGLISLSLSFFALAVLCSIFVKNNNEEVIAAMMREKTGQDMWVPAFSMDDEIIKLDRELFDEEGKNVHRTVHQRASIELGASVTSSQYR